MVKTRKTTPKVSVIMANRNNADFLSESIVSVLNQSFTDFELIIIDDSTDSSRKIIRTYLHDKRVKLIFGPKKGIAAATNMGINRSRGIYIAFVDSDDICISDRFELQTRYLDRHKKIDVVGTNFYYISSNPPKLRKSRPKDFGSMVDGRVSVHNPTCMVRKSVFDRFGLFDIKLKAASDVEFYYRIWNKGAKLRRISKSLYKYRVLHGSSSTQVKRDIQLMSLLIINLKNIFQYHSPFTVRGYLYTIELFLYFLYTSIRVSLIQVSRIGKSLS